MNRRANKFKNAKTEETTKERREGKQKKRAWENPTGAKSEKKELTKEKVKSKLMRQERTERIQCIKNHKNILKPPYEKQSEPKN